MRLKAAPKRKKKPTPPPLPSPEDGTGGLVVIDSEPVRAKARKTYEKSRNDVEKAKKEREAHITKDVPLYQTWFHKNFGELLADVQQTLATIRQKEQIILAIDELIAEEGMEPSEAYQAVMDAVKKREQKKSEPQGDHGGKDRRKSKKESEQDPETEDDFHNFFKSFLEGVEAFKKTSTDPRIKNLYRELVRLLHPDTCKNPTPQHLEWWHQVQEAYEQEDADQLEAILTLYRLEQEKNPKADAPVSIIQRLTKQLKATLRKIKRELSEYERDPAWKFSERKDLRPLAGRIQDDFLFDLKQMKARMAELDQVLDRLARKKRRRRKPSGYDQWFD